MKKAAQQLCMTALFRSLVNIESIAIKQAILTDRQYEEPKPELHADYIVNPARHHALLTSMDPGWG